MAGSKGELAMLGVRFFASTAIILMLSAAAGGALAEPKSGTALDAGAPAPGATNVAAPTEGQPGQTAAKPTDSADQPAAAADAAPAAAAKPEQPTGQPAAADAAPAAAAKPEQSTDQPAAANAAPAAAANPEQSTDQPAAAAVAPAAATPNPNESPEEPVTPAVTEVPPAKLEPPASAGEGAVPTTSVAAPPAATPSESAVTSAPNAVVEADAAIVEQLRELANGKFDRIIGGKKERAAIEAFYSGRNYAPLWITDGKANARGIAAIAYLGQVYTDGLDPADYPAPNFASFTDPAALAEAEIKFTVSVVAYAHHAQMGRVHWSR